MPQPPPRSLRGLSRSQSRRTGKPRGGRYSVGAGAPVAGGEGGSGPPSNLAPTVSISSPSAGTTITTLPFGVTISASDSDGTIATTQLYANGVLVGSDSAAPYVVNLSPADGQVTLVARAIDDDGAPTDSSAVVVTVATGNAAPTVSITSPTAGTTLTTATSTATISASDSDGSITNVELFVDGTLAGSDSTAPYHIAFSAANGARTLTARATDDDSAQTTSSAVVVTVDYTPPAFATTMALKNESGGATESSWVTQPFGHSFKAGDIPAGFYPRFRLGGVTLDYSWWNRTNYADGSWRFAGFMLRMPSALANAATASIDIDAVASPPGAASVGLSDLYAAQIDVEAVGGLTNGNLTGTWNATLSQTIAEAENDIKDLTATAGGNGGGNVCKYYRIGIPFKQGGTSHAGLHCFFWCFVMQDASGGVYDISVLPGVTMPWANKVGDTNWEKIVFASVTLRRANGAVSLMNPVMPVASFQFARGGSGFEHSIARTTNLNTYEEHAAYTVETTGTLPAPLVANAAYLSHFDVSGRALRVSTSGPLDWSGTFGGVTITDAGSGTHTATCRPWVSKSNMLYVCDSTGDYTYIGAPGSTRGNAAPLGCSPKLSMSYVLKTNILLPMEVNNDSDADEPKNGLRHGLFSPILNANEPSGGQWPGPHARAVVEYVCQSHTLARWRNVNACGMMGAWRHSIFMDHSAKNFPTTNTTVDPGVGFSLANYRFNQSIWNPPPSYTGPNGSTDLAGYGRMTSSRMINDNPPHQRAVYNGPYLINGRDECLFAALGAFFGLVQQKVWWEPTAVNFTWNSKTWVGNHWICEKQARDAAWCMRDLTFLIQMCPDAHPHRTELNRLLEVHRDYIIDMHAARDPSTIGSGVVPQWAVFGTDGNLDWLGTHGFSMHYYVVETLRFLKAFRNTALDPVIAEIANWPEVWGASNSWEQTAVYGGLVGQRWYEFDFALCPPTVPGGDGQRRVNPADISATFYYMGFSYNYSLDATPSQGYPHCEWTWDAATDTITWHEFSKCPLNALTDGDWFYFAWQWPQYSAWGDLILPGGMAKYTKYYAGNVATAGDTRTFKLYTDAGLTNLVDITDSSSSWRALDLASNTLTWPRAGTVTMSSGGTGTAVAFMQYRWAKYPRPFLWVKNVSGTFGATDTFTFSGGGGGTCNNVLSQIPMMFYGKWQAGLKSRDQYDPHYIVQQETIMNMLELMGHTPSTAARTNWNEWAEAASFGQGIPYVRRTYPEFRTTNVV